MPFGFNLFRSKGKLGIDIGTSAIKIVELEKESGRFALKNYGLFELKSAERSAALSAQAGHGGDQNILKLPDGEIIWGIKEVLKKAKIKSTNVVASIPAFSTFATVIDMPYVSEQDLAKALPFEARKYIPVPLDEVVLDWSIIDVPKNLTDATKSTTVEVFLAAVPKDETVRYQRIMQGAGLKLRALELENSALTRALLGNDLSPTVIVNIGGRSTSIVILNKGYERLSHNYEVGGFEVTRSIARSLNVSLEKAEELKKKLGIKEIDENVIHGAMKSLIDMMAFETRKTITSYEETKNQKISKVLLVGGLTNMPNFANYFQQKLGRQVTIGNALARVVYPQALSSVIQELSSTFAVATGLAMREL
ncbi:MAG: type IV pilus assembly protein PilM [Candidatus Yanofskybacteria bacterium]|nr:type IV pilus assembly protein PilM [Candidatus Yanofskybacteria bacterium]